MFHASGSESTSTGIPPALITADAHEIIVNEGMITSSPFFIPTAITAASSAAVPLQTAIPYFLPTRFAKFSSSLFTNGPSEDIHPVSIHSERYFFSFPFSSGSFTGIKSFIYFTIVLSLFIPVNLVLSSSPAYGPCFTSIISISSSTSNP